MSQKGCLTTKILSYKYRNFHHNNIIIITEIPLSAVLVFYISRGLWLSSMIWNWCYLNKSWVPPICPVVPMYMISLWHVISLWCVGRHDPSRIDFTGNDQYCWLHATPSKQMVINKQWLSSYGILEHPYVFFCTFWGFIQYISRITHMIHAYCWSPGCQMRPINHPGDPECRPGWSGGRIANLPVIHCL